MGGWYASAGALGLRDSDDSDGIPYVVSATYVGMRFSLFDLLAPFSSRGGIRFCLASNRTFFAMPVLSMS